MSFTEHLLQGISDEERRSGEKQVFISHEFRSKDLRIRLERALKQMELEAYFADKEVTGQFVLNKICKKILITRASIVDLSTSNPNVYFELGVAIGLNKPIFIVLRDGAPVPTLLENFVKLRFTSYTALEQSLITYAPKWLTESIEHHLLYNTHCHFVSVPCPDRLPPTPWLNNQRRYLLIDQIEHHDGDNQICFAGDPDLSAELRAALDLFQYLPVLLDDVPLTNTFRFCDYCRSLRSSNFVLCHLDKRSSANVYLLLGLVTGLGLPSLLLIHRELDPQGRSLFDIPSMLNGIDSFRYESYTDIGERLGDAVEGFIEEQKGKRGISKALVFREQTRPEKREEHEAEPTSLSEDEINAILQDAIDRVSSAPSALDLARSVLLGVRNVFEDQDVIASLTILNPLLPEQEPRNTQLVGDSYTIEKDGTLVKTEAVPLNHTIIERTLQQKLPTIIPDVRNSRDYIEVHAQTLSEIVVPIMLDEEPMGTLAVEFLQLAAFDQRDVELLQQLSVMVAIGLKNLRHFEALSLVTSRLSQRIFLSYHRSDKLAVRNLYQQLRAAGFDPWLDEENLLPGQQWEQEIRKAIRESHIILICLSRSSTNKKGYTQKEIRYALNVAEEQPAGTIFLIPVRLEECNVPSSLNQWQWVDLFEADGFERLMRGLRWHADQVGIPVAESSTTAQSSVDETVLVAALQRLSSLPLDTIPEVAPLPQSSRILPSHNPLFVGRENELRELARRLKSGGRVSVGSVVAVAGLAGIGKTQLAFEFVHRYGQFFAGGVFWLNFADPKVVSSEVAACGGGGAMNLRPDYHTLPLEEQVQLVQAAWQSPIPRLLVFDNCEEDALLDEWLPKHGGCRVLVTSRRQQWNPVLGVDALRLEGLPHAASLVLLRQFRPDLPNDDADLNVLVEKLSYLPLALRLAAEYLSRHGHDVTPAQYLEELRRRGDLPE